MTPADAQQQRLLERLREAGDEPVAFAELHAAGIAFPAAVVSELELNGYAIERVYDHGRLVGVRLLQPEPPDTIRRAPAAPAAPIASAVHLAITADDPGCEVWRVLGLLDAAKARGFTIIVRAVQSSGNARSCRSASVDRVVSAARRADDPRQARLRARTGAGRAARCVSSTLTEPHGKVTASRRTAAGLRPALPAPLPKSASDWMHARGRFPKCSGTNAATPPMIGSPSFANRFAKSLLVVRSPRPCWSCASAR